ncbi:oligoendopeptidase, pepF/M3 family [Alkalispirochaeta americana]|uniref:Oligoendopeptidase, pepF/M3 family n=1 Tax=Alkalispirochaeta americana TaxID=159291 RepID=A0A1N6TLK4_9SPIO|nr:M3 family oligoendopeptidase [Alkalispirochaeta americana]SIQ54161.1 oligoendopeptidase, pepF/M3 family [Alkalispirochaeta americana]
MPTGPTDSTPGQDRWQLHSIYPGLASEAFLGDLAELDRKLAELREILERHEYRALQSDATSRNLFCQELPGILTGINALRDLYEQLEHYCYAVYSTATTGEEALRTLNAVTKRSVPLAEITVRFRQGLSQVSSRDLTSAARESPLIEGALLFLQEERDLATHQMSLTEESLAAELARPGADAWSRLQETIASSLRVPWEGEQELTMVEIRNLASDADRGLRRRAWKAECDAWRSMELPLSYALNGVKGASSALDQRRGWQDTLERSLHQNRLSRKSLESLVTAMRAALPLFRRYLRAKAAFLGIERLSFYDLAAPVGTPPQRISLPGALDQISQIFASFDPALGDFVLELRDKHWIDAETRSGKVGGAYCMDFPLARESRILINFDGSWDSLSTLAHELGHAWHSHVLKDLPSSERRYPMILAETASLFCEHLVFEASRSQGTPGQQLFILDQFLQSATQIIVDILSRFEFESALIARRAEGELSPGTLNELMLTAQRRTYGEALNSRELHPYMWAVKSHYYRADLAFYNYPYAFGQLFALALFRQNHQHPRSFPDRYRDLLGETGRCSAAAIASRVGADLETVSFWEGPLQEIQGLVCIFEDLLPGAPSLQSPGV